MQREVQAVGDGQSDQRCDGGPQTEAELRPEGADPVANLVPEGQFALAQFGLSPVHSLTLPEGALGQHPRPIQGDVRAASAVRSKRAGSSLYDEDHRPASLANRGFTLSA